MTVPARVRGAGLARSGWITAAVGAVIVLVSGALGAILTVCGVESITDVDGDGIHFRDSVELTLGAEQTVRLYKSAGRLSPDCSVTRDGQYVPIDTWAAPSSLPDWVAFAEFTAPEAGRYTVTCVDADDLVAAEPRSIGAWIAAILGIVVLVIGIGAGLLVALVGLILWVTGALSRRDRPDLSGTRPGPPTAWRLGSVPWVAPEGCAGAMGGAPRPRPEDQRCGSSGQPLAASSDATRERSVSLGSSSV